MSLKPGAFLSPFAANLSFYESTQPSISLHALKLSTTVTFRHRYNCRSSPSQATVAQSADSVWGCLYFIASSRADEKETYIHSSQFAKHSSFCLKHFYRDKKCFYILQNIPSATVHFLIMCKITCCYLQYVHVHAYKYIVCFTATKYCSNFKVFMKTCVRYSRTS